MSRILFGLTLAVPLLCACAHGGAHEQIDQRRMQMDEIVREAGLDTARPSEVSLDKVASLLRERQRRGIWVAAPLRLSIDRDQEARMLVFDHYDTTERGARYLSESGIVVATRIESRETRAALISEPRDEVPSDGKPKPISSARLLQQTVIPLRERLPDLTWRKGHYIVDVILDRETSNRAHLVLDAGQAAARDPAVAEFIDRQPAGAIGPTDIRPVPLEQRALPSFRRSIRSLPVPPTTDIVLAAERVSLFRPGASSVLRGSYRLSVPAGFYLNPVAQGEPTAVVPITLVITGNIMPGPFVVPLRVPTYDPIERGKTESIVTGQFEIDLFALPETSKVPQTYLIRAYSGEVRSETATSAVVVPEMLK